MQEGERLRRGGHERQEEKDRFEWRDVQLCCRSSPGDRRDKESEGCDFFFFPIFPSLQDHAEIYTNSVY